MQYTEILEKLNSLSNPKNVEGMARFGIKSKSTILGISIPNLRIIAKEINKKLNINERHTLAQQLWDSKIHEAQILAGMIDNPNLVTEKQMDSWIKDFDSWDVCDQICMNLFDKTPFAFNKAVEWTSREEEFERRAGFALMSCLAWHDKTSQDKDFIKFFALIEKYSIDERNFVKKAVNWALRQIGKRNLNLNKEAIILAKKIKSRQDGIKSAKWIANDAIRELTSEAVKRKLENR